MSKRETLITVALTIILFASLAVAGTIKFYPNVLPNWLNDLGLKALLPALFSFIFLITQKLVPILWNMKEKALRNKGILYGRAVLQPHFFKRVIREEKTFFLLLWENLGWTSEKAMENLYGCHADAVDMQELARETTINKFTSMALFVNKRLSIAYSGAINTLCDRFKGTKEERYPHIVLSVNEDATTLNSIVLTRFLAIPPSMLNLFLDKDFIINKCAAETEWRLERFFTLHALAKQIFTLNKKEGVVGDYKFKIEKIDLSEPGNMIFWDSRFSVSPLMPADELSKLRGELIEELDNPTYQYNTGQEEGLDMQMGYDEKREGEVYLSLDALKKPIFGNNKSFDERLDEVSKLVEHAGGAICIK